jgi:carbamoyltransferase
LDVFFSYTIGLATTFHDPAIAIVAPDGEVLFAEASERYLQYKRAPYCDPDPAPRMEALVREFLPKDADIVVATSWGQDFVDFLDGSFRSGQFTLENLLALSPDLNRSLVPERSERTFIASLHLAQKRAGLGLLLGLDRAFGTARITDIRRYAHHLTHAAYACWSSPFRDASCLVVDGMGETGASAIFALENGVIREVKRHRGRESVGFFFGLLTDLAGFDQTKGEEWKIMGLAPYGKRDPDLLALLNRLWRQDGDKLVFADLPVIREVVHMLTARRPPEALETGWADLARCAQDVFEAMMAVLLAGTARLAPSPNLVLSGGCALNSAFNGKIAGKYSFAQVHVPSAPADDGNAIGAAWLAHKEHAPHWPSQPVVTSAYLGSRVDPEPMERLAQWDKRAQFRGEAIIEDTAALLAAGKLVGWVQGRAEFGPRSLGNRSILADPRPKNAKDILNAKVKYREAFRPFAPSILADHGPDWFEHYQDSPFMERTLVWREEKRLQVPAVVHEDGTGRLQSVTPERNPRYHALLSAFHRRTGVPVLLNTSFNIMGKPILHTAEDAILMFFTTGLDALVVGDWLVLKDEA